ncbi:MAG: hypothetical protein ACYDDI_07695 [Candidatus Acidiferrales bacterium]
MMNRKLCWIFGATALGLVSLLLPNLSLRWYLLYPYPLIPTTVDMLLTMRALGPSPMEYFLLLLGPILFLVSSPPLTFKKAQLSRKDFWVLLVFSALEVLCLALTWRGGYRYVPGPRYTDLTVVLSVFWLAALWLAFVLARRRKSYAAIFAYHFIFVLWLLMYAFPWFGEMP